MASNTVDIDGSILEGGGQILRNAASLSCILGSSIRVNNIRANRSNPGLRPQHLSGLQLIRDICKGKLIGGEQGSPEITFQPGAIKGGSYLADTKTAGSVCLLLQAALPCLLFADAPTEIVLRGGTNAEMAPQIDYFTWVFKPMVEHFGIHFQCDIIRRGYFPKGGGEIRIYIEPLKSLTAVDLTTTGDLTKISGRAFTAGSLPIKVSHAMAAEAEKLIKKQYPAIPITIEALKEQPNKAVGNGTGIILLAETNEGKRLAGSALGKRGVSAEEVGKIAAKQLLAQLSTAASVDKFLQDQLIMFMALARGKSRVFCGPITLRTETAIEIAKILTDLIIFMALARGKSRVSCGPITLHTETAIEIAKMLTDAKFEIEQVTEDQNIIVCEGIGLQNKNLR